MRIRSLLPVVLAAALTGAACGGDAGPTIDDYADAFAASIRADQDEDTVQVDEAEALCIGTATAGTIGLERLEETGTPAEIEEQTVEDLSIFDLSEVTALEIADDYITCVPDFTEQFIAFLDVGDATDCVADAITTDDLRPAMAAAVNGDEPTDDDMAFVSEALGECEVPAGLQTYVDAIAASIQADAGPSLGMTEDAAICFAENAVAVIGEQRLAAVGDAEEFTAATEQDLAIVDLSMSELQTIAAGYFDCSPTTAENFRQLFLDGTALQGEQLACVDDALTDQILVDIIASSLGGLDPERGLGAFQEDLAACG